MKLYEKYPQLRNREFVLNMLVENVYATMQLENQGVHRSIVRTILLGILKEQELKGQKFFAD